MYGYTEAAYERVTGVKCSYKMFMDALDLLRKNDSRIEKLRSQGLITEEEYQQMMEEIRGE